MKFDEIWSFSYEEIRDYFLNMGAEEKETVLMLPECRIELEHLPNRELGSLSFMQVRVMMSGPKCESVHTRFFMDHLRGGA